VSVVSRGRSGRLDKIIFCNICSLLLINGIDVAILWAGLANRSKEISCSRNLVAARDFYDVRQTFYTCSYENLVEKRVRDTPLLCKIKFLFLLEYDLQLPKSSDALYTPCLKKTVPTYLLLFVRQI